MVTPIKCGNQRRADDKRRHFRQCGGPVECRGVLAGHLDESFNAARISYCILSAETLVCDMLQAPDGHVEGHLRQRRCCA